MIISTVAGTPGEKSPHGVKADGASLGEGSLSSPFSSLAFFYACLAA